MRDSVVPRGQCVGQGDGEMTEDSLEGVREVLARHRGTIMARYEAVGVGVGKSESGSRFLIVVYLTSAGSAPSDEASIEGIPLKFVVTGRVRAQRRH